MLSEIGFRIAVFSLGALTILLTAFALFSTNQLAQVNPNRILAKYGGRKSLPPLNLYARVRLLLPIARETAGAARIRHSLLPLFGENQGQSSGRSCREIVEPYFVGLTHVAC